MPSHNSYLGSQKITFITNTSCEIYLQFKDEKTKKLWTKLHRKKCNVCKNCIENDEYENIKHKSI